MVDVLQQTIARQGIPSRREDREISDSYIATIHRQENIDNRRRLNKIMNAMNLLDKQVIMLSHPRLSVRLKKFSISAENFTRISFVEPLHSSTGTRFFEDSSIASATRMTSTPSWKLTTADGWPLAAARKASSSAISGSFL